MPELDRYVAFIHLGNVQAHGRLELAIRAVDKTLRHRGDGVRLVVATASGLALPSCPLPSNWGFHTPDELRRTLQRNDITVLAPCFSDPHGDIILHALASGVPLGALNLAPVSAEVRTGLSLDGDAFLAVDRPARRPH